MSDLDPRVLERLERIAAAQEKIAELLASVIKDANPPGRPEIRVPVIVTTDFARVAKWNGVPTKDTVSMKTWIVLVVLTLALALAAFFFVGHAHSSFDNGQYEGVDPKIRSWFKSATTRNGLNCCDIADGRMVEWRRNDRVPSGYEVLMESGIWQPVPIEAVLPPETGNPTGRGVAWFYPGTMIRCFMPGPET